MSASVKLMLNRLKSKAHTFDALDDATAFIDPANAVLHQCIRSLIGALALDHHGYQRAYDVISRQASMSRKRHGESLTRTADRLHICSSTWFDLPVGADVHLELRSGTVHTVLFEYSLAALDLHVVLLGTPRQPRRERLCFFRMYLQRKRRSGHERIWSQLTRRTSMSSIPVGIQRFG